MSIISSLAHLFSSKAKTDGVAAAVEETATAAVQTVVPIEQEALAAISSFRASAQNQVASLGNYKTAIMQSIAALKSELVGKEAALDQVIAELAKVAGIGTDASAASGQAATATVAPPIVTT